MRTYSNLEREGETYSLPDVEVFYSHKRDQTPDTVFWNEDDKEPMGTGYYYWFCFPGCMPESSPFGPFKTEKEAIEEMRNNLE